MSNLVKTLVNRTARTLLACAAAWAWAGGVGCVPQNRQTAIGRSAPPKSVDLYVAGAVAKENGRREQAVQRLLDAISANPNLIMAREMLGDLYREAGDYSRAEGEYQTLTKLDPYGAGSWRKLGVAQQLLDKLKAAADSYQRALKLNPRDWESSMNVGVVYFALGYRDHAVAFAQYATRVRPDKAVAWQNLGAVLDASGKYADAEQAYRKSLELEGPNAPTLLNLSTNLLLQRKPGEAVSVLDQLVKAEDSASARKRYGDALMMTGRNDEAERQYDAALKLDSRYFAALNALASVRIAQYKASLELDEQKRLAAMDLWKQSLAVNPKQPAVDALMKTYGR